MPSIRGASSAAKYEYFIEFNQPKRYTAGTYVVGELGISTLQKGMLWKKIELQF